MAVDNFQVAVKRSAICPATSVLFSIVGCSSDESSVESSDEITHQEVAVTIDRTLSAEDIDPAVYFDFGDPSDPFQEIYAAFRARRANDMADASKPPPIEPYESVHIMRDMPGMH